MTNTALITNDATVLGLLLLVLGGIFYTQTIKTGFFKKFYTYIPALLLCYFIPGLLNTFGIIIGVDLDISFDIVHNSNMTKICRNKEEAQETVDWYIKNDRRYNSPSYKENKYGYVIFNEDTGKILKSINYTPANFDSILSVYNKDNKNTEYNIKNIWFPSEFRNHIY